MGLKKFLNEWAKSEALVASMVPGSVRCYSCFRCSHAPGSRRSYVPANYFTLGESIEILEKQKNGHQPKNNNINDKTKTCSRKVTIITIQFL